MPWIATPETEVRNGDVIIRTTKGRLVAVIYAADSEAETMRRANALLVADPERSCPVCSGDCSAANPPVMNCPMQKEAA